MWIKIHVFKPLSKCIHIQDLKKIYFVKLPIGARDLDLKRPQTPLAPAPLPAPWLSPLASEEVLKKSKLGLILGSNAKKKSITKYSMIHLPDIYNRPGVAGAVLQTHSLLIKWVSLFLLWVFEKSVMALWEIRHGSGRNPSHVETGFWFYCWS